MIKTYFFYAMLGLLGAGIVGYFLFHLGKGLWGMFQDWRLHGELNQLEASAETRKHERAEASRKRLDNGCEHEFDGSLGGFPAGVCHKCGLGREKPSGTCDHVWRAGEGAVPSSKCEKCGRTYSATERGSLA